MDLSKLSHAEKDALVLTLSVWLEAAMKLIAEVLARIDELSPPGKLPGNSSAPLCYGAYFGEAASMEDQVMRGATTMELDGSNVTGSAAEAAADAHRELMLRFCSLGRNCELGFAQRAFGAEPLDLCRWASTRTGTLCQMLRAKFEDVGNPQKIQIYANEQGEYYCVNTRYHFVWHCWAKVGAAAPEALHARECKRLPFLARKLIEDLTDSVRIFVVTSPFDDVTHETASEILDQMHVYGRPTLMYVTQGAPIGVIREGSSLLHATIPEFADTAHVPSTTRPADWLAVCQQADNLMSAQRG